jgi:hypothetical protein
MSKKKRKRRRRRGNGSKGRHGRSNDSLGWHLKMEEFRREAIKVSPGVITRTMRGWELHLSYKPGNHACSACTWGGLLVYPVESPVPPCPDCGCVVLSEPWALAAHPDSGSNDYPWLGRAAEFLGAPAEDKPEKPPKDEKHVVMFSWAETATTNPLGGM